MSEVEPTRQETAAIEPLRQSPSRKKRTAERQITQDDNEVDDDESTSGGLTKNGHPRASAEVMKTRRIVKPRRPPSNSTTAKATKSSETKSNNPTEPTSEESKDEESKPTDPKPNNPFASVALTKPDTTPSPKTSLLGSEKSAIDAPKPSIFGSLTTSNNTPSTTTKPIFGSSTTTSVFGQSTTTASTGFGSVGTNKFTFATMNKSSTSKPFTFATVTTKDSASTGTLFGTSAAGPKTNASQTTETSTPPVPIVVKNGEEDESCTFQMRVKLFRFVEVRPKPGAAVGEVDSGRPAVASVPPSNNIGSATTKKEEIKEDDKQNTEKEDGATGSTGEGDNEDVAKKKMEWKEVGIGPLRVLEKKKIDGAAVYEKDKSATEKDSDDKATNPTASKSKRGIRLVQRRECTPGGQGTKLILNLPLQNGCHVLRKGDKFVRLSAFEPEEQKEGEKKEVTIRCVQYLFKTKTVLDADSLQEVLQNSIDDCGK